MTTTEAKSDLRWEIFQYCVDSLESDVIGAVARDWKRFSRDEVAAQWEQLPYELARPVGEPNAFMHEVPPGSLLGDRARTLIESGALGADATLHPVDPDLQKALKGRAITLLRGDMQNFADSARSKSTDLDAAADFAGDEMPGSDAHIDETELDPAAQKGLTARTYRMFRFMRLGMKPKEIQKYFTEHEYRQSRKELQEWIVAFQGRAAAFGTAIWALMRRPYERVSMIVSRTDPAIATGPASSNTGSGRAAGAVILAIAATVAGGAAITTGGEDVVKTPPAKAAPQAPNTLPPYGELHKPKPEKKKQRKKKRKKKVAPAPAPPQTPQYVPPAPSQSSSGRVDDGSAEFLPEHRGSD